MFESQNHIIYLTPFDHCAVTWCLLVVWRTSFGKKGQFQGQLWRSEEEVAVRQMHIFALIIKLHFCTLFGTGHWAVSTALQILSPHQLRLKPVSHLTPNRPLLHTSFTYPKLNMDGFSILNGFFGYVDSTQKIFLKFFHAQGFFQTSWFTS